MCVTLALETVGSAATGSLALLGDAGHVFMDLLALLLTLGAIRVARSYPTARATWGKHRAEVIAALLNGLTVAVLGAVLVYHAAQRLTSPKDIDAPLLLVFAAGGLALNAVVASRLSGSRDVNVRSAFLHVVGDLASSATVVAGALLMHLSGSSLFDPLLGIALSLLLFAGAFRIVRDSSAILMENSPAGLDLALVLKALNGVPGVRGVHDLHAWALCSNVTALSAHVEVDDASVGAEMSRSLSRAADSAVPGFLHTTFQLEPGGCESPPCGAPLQT
jgi:cobalt-zinc-cadmium efflux system protein